MKTQQTDSDGLLLVRFKVSECAAIDFEKWKSKAVGLIKIVKGFIDISFLDRIKEADYVHVLIRFGCDDQVRAWLNSDTRKKIFNDTNSTWLTERREVVHSGNIFWYRVFESTKKWKQWAVTFIAVYPLTLVIPGLVKGITNVVPLYFFAGIISALMISGFMIYMVLPFIHNLFRKWLHE